jgi:Rrf2 family protein
MVSQKCQYAIRAVFELAKSFGRGPVKIGQIAEAQAIPTRFLEVILNEMRQGGFVESRRGADGGYQLVRNPDVLTIGDVIRFIEGPVGPVSCVAGNGDVTHCPLHSHCVFIPMWEKVRAAMLSVYDTTTFAGLAEEEARKKADYVPSYAI